MRKTPSDEIIDVDPAVLSRMIRDAITGGLTTLIMDTVRERLDYMQGKIR